MTTDSSARCLLEGIRVFDLTIAMVGPWSTMLLGSMGADVLHVEQPDVNLSVGVPPLINGDSIGYITWNMNKRGLSLDLKQEEQQEFAHALIATSDVFVCNMRSGAADRLGMGYEQLRAINPGLVYCLATGYGRSGPRSGQAGADTQIQALTGFWSTQGARGDARGQMYRHYTQIDATTGNTITQAVLMGLYARQQTGVGQLIDITMLDAAATLQVPRMAEHFAGVVHAPQGSSAFATAPDRAFRCEDGQWLGVSVNDDAQWASLCALLERDDITADARFATNRDRVANRDALEQLLEPVFLTRPQSHWIFHLERRGVPYGIPMGWETLRHHRQVVDNGYLRQIETSKWGPVWYGGPPWRFSKTPARITATPLPGEATDDLRAEVAERAGRDHAAPAATVENTAVDTSAGPLTGLNVVEFSEGVAGPMTARLLGDGGANVIKLETPEGDPVRRWGGPAQNDTSVVFSALNRNKRSVVVDSGQSPELDSLLTEADVLIVDNGRTDVDAIMQAHPDLVVCVVSCWGPEGPWADLPGGELPAQLASEAVTSLGKLGDEPVRLGGEHAGMLTAQFAVQGIVAALVGRREFGGQRVDVSLFGSLLQMRSTLWVALSNPDRWWGFHLDSYIKPPEFGYTCKDTNIFFTLRRGDNIPRELVTELVTELKMEFAFDDPRWKIFSKDQAGGIGRYSHLVHDIWDRGLSQWTFAEASKILDKHGSWVFPYHDYEEFVNDEQSQYLGIFIDVKDQTGALSTQVRPPWQFSSTPATVRLPAPMLGEHTREVLDS
jgi:crotonobetainyl-CoA:carnitine CoA-transferase CaiB-like acyl-CoA transferase